MTSAGPAGTSQGKVRKLRTRSGQNDMKRRAPRNAVTAKTKPEIDWELARASNELRDRGLQGIGRFLFEFSQLEFTIQAVLTARLGLSEAYFNIVTAPYDFRKLCTVTCKVSRIKYPTKKAEIEKLFKECLKLNDSRVIVAHGLWTDDMDGLSVRSVSRGTFQPQVHSFKKDELHRLSQKAQELMKRVLGFQGAK